MEALADAIAVVENSNGGKLKPSKMFKRLELWQNFMYQSRPPEFSWPGIQKLDLFTNVFQFFRLNVYLWRS